MLKSNGFNVRLTRGVVVTVLLLLITGTLAIGSFLPVKAAAPAQAQDATPTPGNMMDSDMMGERMMNGDMSMSEMGTMIDQMMAQMNSIMGTIPVTGTIPMCGMPTMTGAMPMAGMMPTTNTLPISGTMSMSDMGMMMQMMGMMQMQMGCMQIMMGTMMSGGMMDGGIMGEGLKEENATPEATQAAPAVTATVEPSATATVSESSESSEPEVAASDSDRPTPVLAPTPQSATAGAVTIEAIPLPAEKLLEFAFAITLETHSVELDFDLAERATLMIGKANFPATTWEHDAPNGHHVVGTLNFTIDQPAYAALAEVDEVTLELRDIDGQLVTLGFAVDEK